MKTKLTIEPIIICGAFSLTLSPFHRPVLFYLGDQSRCCDKTLGYGQYSYASARCKILGSGAAATFRLCPECAVCLFASPKESGDDGTTVYDSTTCFLACTVHSTVFALLWLSFNSCWRSTLVVVALVEGTLVAAELRHP
jgi:hypothetical protein